MAKRKRVVKTAKRHVVKSPYFMQPGKRGQVIVLHRACGNRAVPKVCGNMPSRAHAKMLIAQLERAEGAVKDLFLEATDDGIEALEAILSACCEEVMKRAPRVHSDGGSGGGAKSHPDGGGDTAAARPRRSHPRQRDPRRQGGGQGGHRQRGPRPYQAPESGDAPRGDASPTRDDDRGDGYNAAAV